MFKKPTVSVIINRNLTVKGEISILEFKHINRADKPIFDDYFRERDYHASECCFGTNFIWRHGFDTYWAISHGSLIMMVTVQNKTFITPPFGGVNEELPQVLDELRAFFGGKPFEIHGIYEDTIARFEKYLPEVTEYEEDRNNWDYVYEQEKLATLSGRKLHQKKNHYNAFVKDNPDFVYEPMGGDNLTECFEFARKWIDVREETDPSIIYEEDAIKEALDNFTFLKMRGGLIRLDGEVKAFSFGEITGMNTAIIHVEKADPNIRGLYTAINKEFVSRAWGDVKYINREEDMGKDGLRKAKESYKPAFMVKKYNTVIR